MIAFATKDRKQITVHPRRCAGGAGQLVRSNELMIIVDESECPHVLEWTCCTVLLSTGFGSVCKAFLTSSQDIVSVR